MKLHAVVVPDVLEVVQLGPRAFPVATCSRSRALCELLSVLALLRGP